MNRSHFLLSLLGACIICCSVVLSQSPASDAVPWSARIAKSFLAMHPDSITYADEAKSVKWNYEQGVMIEAFYQMWRRSGDSIYFRSMKKHVDYYVTEDGSIRTYRIDEYNLDNITPGKAVLRLWNATGEKKYSAAADTLRKQLAGHPRTLGGGFWHKKIYPYQMWLDGLYMAEPFYTMYSVIHNDTAALNDVALQFTMIALKARDLRTGLYFHGWDESRKQRWADPQTGCSPSLWGRSLGWYAMALVDVLEILPADHPRRRELIKIFSELCSNLLLRRDAKSGIWYQVVDRPDASGNYLEASCSSMFIYVFAKGARLGYLPKEFSRHAEVSFQGLLRTLVVIDDRGIVHLTNICRVGGLGGNPYRDGSLEYYFGEPKRTDDFKGYGPFWMAAIEIERNQSSSVKQ